MNRFASGGTFDDREAEQYHDRFVSPHPDYREFDNQTYHQSATEYLGKLPDDQFQEAARNAYSQAAPQQFTLRRNELQASQNRMLVCHIASNCCNRV